MSPDFPQTRILAGTNKAFERYFQIETDDLREMPGSTRIKKKCEDVKHSIEN